MRDIVDTFVEVTLKKPEDFLKVRETLTRIGVASTRDKKLFQSCHILHKRGKFYIVHFKSMFALDGKSSTLSADDAARTNRIAKLLSDWGLIDLIKDIPDEECAPIGQIKIIRHDEKSQWTLVPKYQIGRKSTNRG